MWIKWYPMQWLHSTCRDELNAAQRATFQDFVCLAAVSPKPGSFKFVSDSSLSRMLNTPIDTIRTTIKICIKKKRIHITEGPEGQVCKILKWPDYQAFGAKNPKKKNNLLLIRFNFKEKKWENITMEDKAGWKDAYPAVDVEQHLRIMREWLLANPTKRKSNYRKFITNWLSRQQDKGGTKLTKEEQRKKKLDEWVNKPLEEEK